MKLAVCLFVLVFIASTYAKPQRSSRGCIIRLRECVRECEEGTHAYSPGCGPKTAEATCDNPDPKEERVIICDYSECYCDAPTVRDTVSGKCVTLDQCPKK